MSEMVATHAHNVPCDVIMVSIVVYIIVLVLCRRFMFVNKPMPKDGKKTSIVV